MEEMKRSRRLQEKIRVVNDRNQKRNERALPIGEFQKYMEDIEHKNPDGKKIYEKPYRDGMKYLDEKEHIEETLFDYMIKYNRAAMIMYQDKVYLDKLLSEYDFFIQSVIYGFRKKYFEQNKVELYKKFRTRNCEISKIS